MDQRRLISGEAYGARKQAGLTLVELLVVMAILAFAAAVVILNAPPSRPPAREAAEQFAARLQSMLDAAIIEGGAYRLEMTSGGYGYAQYQDGDWRRVSTTAIETGEVAIWGEATDAAASNALALNGNDGEINDADEERVVFPIDPYAGGAGFIAHFDSRRGGWSVTLSPEGEISVGRR